MFPFILDTFITKLHLANDVYVQQNYSRDLRISIIAPLRRRGKILCVSYGPDSSVTQRSTVMRKLRKSTTALRLSHKSK